MQFEEFDRKAQDAATNHHPAYDEKAWGMMEKLLDKHLPKKENKRRRFLFLLFLLVGLGTAGILLLQAVSNKNPLADSRPGPQQPAFTVMEKPANNLQQEPVVSKMPKPGPGTEEEKIISNPLQVKEKGTGDLPLNVPGEKPAKNNGIQIKERNESVVPLLLNTKNKAEWGVPKTNAATGLTEKTQVNKREAVAASTPGDSKPVAKANEPGITTPDLTGKKTTEQKTQNKQVQSVPVVKRPQPLQQKNNLFLAFSAGPDVSFTAGGKPGTTKINGGIGIGFTYKNRVTLRTGIYDGRKIYKASPEAYHAPDIFYVYYPYLERVRANCRIKEVPVILSYHFGRSEKNSWMLSTGISSLVMKEEVYDYTYKRTANGPLVHRRWSIVDKEKHLFSVLTLGAGFQRKIGKRVSILAEPYLKIPLTGVGYGNVKLYSSGLSFSVAVNPFAAKPQKIFSAE